MTDQIDHLRSALGSSYAIEREIGRGGMATVYLATDRKHQRKVAIKVLRPELAAAVGHERFLNEIKTTAQLSNLHILPLLDSGDADGTLYYVMPFVEGESLRERLHRENQLTLDATIEIACDVAAALSYAHDHGVIHRDIKPENIMLTTGEAVVMDFGIARAVTTAGGERLTTSGLAVGTPAYMSPEQSTGTTDVDSRTDIYSLGTVVFEMLAGEPPFTGPNPQSVIAKRLTDAVPRLTTVREVPNTVEGAVRKALARAPADRWATVSEFASALRAERVTRGSYAAPLRRKRSQATLIVTGLTVIALAVGAVVEWPKLFGPRARNPKQVAVLPFENKTGDPALDALGRNVAERLTRGLTETGVVELTGAVGDAAAAKRAGTLVSGTLYQRGDSLEFSATLTEGVSGTVLSSVGPLRAPAAAPDAASEQLTQRVMGGVAMMFDETYGNQGATVGQPPTYAAYREYRVGEEYFYGNQGGDSAIAHFRRAVALDPTFQFPVIRIVTAFTNTGRPVQADSALKTVEVRRGSLSPFEGYYVDVSRASLRGDAAGYYIATQQMVRAAPKSDFASYWHAIGALKTGRWQEVVAVLEKLDPESRMLRGRLFYYEYLTTSLHRLKEHKRELAAAQQARRQYPGSLRPRQLEVRALAALGKVDEVHDRISESLALGRDRANSAATVMLSAVREFRAHGNPAVAKSVLTTLFSWLDSRPPSEARTEAIRWERARALELDERLADAQALLDSLATEHPENVEYLGALGIIAARQGNRAGAERISAALAALDRPFLSGAHTYQRASIAAVLGDKQRAVQLLADAIAQGDDFYRGQDSDARLESLHGYPPYELLAAPKR